MASPLPPPTKRVKLDVSSHKSSFSQRELELAVGIAGYVHPDLPGWQGVFKQRYADFLVNEIGLDGKVAHLTDFGEGFLRQREKKKKVEEEEEEVKKEQKKVEVEVEAESSAPMVVEDAKGKAEKAEEQDLSPENPKLQSIARLAGPETAEFCSTLLASINGGAIGSRPEHLTKSVDREERGLVHAAIREFSSGKIDSVTLSGDQEGCIRIYASTGQSDMRQRKRGNRAGRRRNKAGRGNGEPAADYCHFLVYKVNRDTMDVMGILPHLIGGTGGKNLFSLAGNKDKRAVTVSWFSAYKVRAERLAQLNQKEDGLRGCHVGNFCYKEIGLGLGDLYGNEFVITLRDCVSSDSGKTLEEVVGAAMQRVKETGFINYFGLQRFGTHGVGTWEVGVDMLKGNWRATVEKILSYDPAILERDDDSVPSEEKSRAQACHVFLTTYDYQKAVELIPRRSNAERAILTSFRDRGIEANEHGGRLDYMAALQAVPRKMRTIYLHAFQSYVWNYVVTERIAWGTKVLPGDLVMAGPTTAAENNVPNPAPTNDAQEIDQDGEVIIRAPVDETVVANAVPEEEKFKRARPLSKEEAESGKYTIKDIVLPTPGWDIIYPQNALMDVYNRVMKEHGLDPLNMKRSHRETSLPGSYRHVISTFINGEASYEVRKYRGEEQIVKTDLEVLKEKEAAAAEGVGKKDGDDGVSMEIDVQSEESTMVAVEGEEKTAVVLRFQLGTSTYATMALRELMKDGVKVFVPEFGRT
ncbi:tRNA pseudouridine synthase D [Choiromyces venosus 120613-1]|uniref:tRNA pseudouridine synthase D n=1 Tax=Choiromyces venosus 120613-1 TaxID=1336337 RepID=A0A3N4JJW3_9PEZI|nr:tRNA pseudouridine synthase D [Choiromyces venosus 120613-1]